MKVLHVINDLRVGGAEKLLLDSLPLYKKNGIDSDLLLIKDANSSFRDALNNKINIYTLTKNSIYNPFLIFKIIPFLRKYDLVHVHLFPSHYWIVLAKILSFCNTPIVFTEHSTSNNRRKNKYLNWLDKLMYYYLSHIVCISEEAKNSLSKYLGTDSKISVIENGINLELYNSKNVKDKAKEFDFFDKNDIKLIQVSGFKNPKDHTTLIRSLEHLPHHVKLILVGDGYLLNDTKLLVNNLKLNDRVLFLGNRLDIPELVNYADIVILSSLYEGLPLALLEGMAAHKPVIASSVPGNIDLVKEVGLLFTPKDSKDLAKNVKKLMDVNYYTIIADKCLDKAQEYSIEKMISNYISIYNNCISNE